MALNVMLIPQHVLKDIAQNMGWGDTPFVPSEELRKDPVPREYLEQIKELSAEEAFEKYCDWHGLIHWAGTLRRTWGEIQSAEAP